MINLRQRDDLRDLRPRFQAMVIVVLVGFLGLFVRLCQIQILEGDHYTRRAERNFIDVVDVEAPRGRVFDAEGRPLATNRPAYTLYITAWARFVRDGEAGVQPSVEGKRVPMDDETRDLIASLIDFVDDADRQEFLAKIEALRADEAQGMYAQVARRNLDWEEFARIQARLDSIDPWVEIRESSKRYYPEQALVGFVTGHMGNITPKQLEGARHLNYRPGDRIGKTGIERQWENYLRGRLGRRARVVDARSREVADPPREAVEALPEDHDPIPGQDIYLTLDLDLQRVAYEALAEKLAGGVVAMEVKTGKIIAMVSVPSLDPNLFEQPIPAAQWQAWADSPLKPFIDKTVQEHFFPGSTYKVVSAIAALSHPEFDPDQEYECEGFIKYGGRRFGDQHVHGPMSLESAIVESCNSYFYQLAIDNILSLDRMEQVARSLGLGERSGLGLNGEVRGTIPTEEFEARGGTYQGGVRLNSAIGQGNVKATVLQLAVLYAAIANGGYVMTPYLVDRIETNEGKLVLTSQPQRRNDQPVIDPVDRERIHRGLVGVVNDEEGTAYSERLPNIVVAGKTGTAQVGREKRVVDPDDGEAEPELEGWDTSQDHAWFAAYAPAGNPTIVVVAMVEHGGIGADAAAPIVMKVMSHYIGSTISETDTPLRAYGEPPPLPGKRSEAARPAGGAAPGANGGAVP